MTQHTWVNSADALGRPRLRCSNCRSLFAAKLIREECVPPAPKFQKRGSKRPDPIPRCEPRPERLKRCNSCKHWLPVVANFDRDKKSPDFHARTCKACKSEMRYGYDKP